MKTKMKKLLSALLALAMASGLFAVLPFTASAAESTVDWDEFYIITQPQSQTVAYNKSATLRVEVNVPDGVEVEYRWYRGIRTRIGGDEPVLVENFLDRDAKDWVAQVSNLDYKLSTALTGRSHEYSCVIFGYEKDADGNVISTVRLESQTVTVTMNSGNALEKLYTYIVYPFVLGFQLLAPISVMTGFLAIPFLPVIYPFAVLTSFIVILLNT